MNEDKQKTPGQLKAYTVEEVARMGAPLPDFTGWIVLGYRFDGTWRIVGRGNGGFGFIAPFTRKEDAENAAAKLSPRWIQRFVMQIGPKP